MNKINLLYLSFGLCLIALVISGSSNGVADVQGVDRTGSPISLASCNSCHIGGNFGATFQIEVIDQNSGNTVSEYTPGNMYDVQFTVNTTTGNPQEYGFQSVALMGSGNDNAGIFSNPAPNTELHTIANGRTYAEHLASNPSNAFSVEWQAPAAGNGPVTFYGAGNAVNNNGSTSGDQGTTPISLQLSESAICMAPGSVSSTVNDDDVVLNWTPSVGATGYEITGGPASSPNAVTLSVGAVTSFQVNNLTRNVNYVWKIKALCGNDSSPFSVTDQFFIPPLVCNPPANIVSNVSGNSVTLTWDPVPNAIGYTINGGPTAAPTAVFLDVPGGGTSSFTVNNLNTGGYAWRVRAICSLSPSVVSAYTSFDQFSIPGPSQKQDDALFTEIDEGRQFEVELYPNPANGFVDIKMIEGLDREVDIEIYDMQGRQMDVHNDPVSNAVVRLNTRNLSTGIYQVVINADEDMTIKRLIISR